MIDDVTRALVAHVRQASPDLGDWVVIHSLSAGEPGPEVDKLAVCLLAVDVRDADIPAGPLDPLAGHRPPAALRLSYLITHLGPHEEAMARIARLLEIFQSTPVLGTAQLPPALADRVDRLAITLHPTTAEERHHIWSALGRPGRLGVFYDVEVLPVAQP